MEMVYESVRYAMPQRAAGWLRARAGAVSGSPRFVTDLVVRGLVVVLALAGVGITAYLTYAGAGGEPHSPWANVGGVPLSTVGLAAFVFVAVMASAPYVVRLFAGESGYRRAAFYTALMLVLATASMGIFSVYLLYGEWAWLDLEVLCVWCIVAKIGTLPLALMGLFSYGWRSYRLPLVVAVGAMAITVLVSFLVFTVPEAVVAP